LRTICLNWPQSLILPISALQVAGIIGISHQQLAIVIYFWTENIFNHRLYSIILFCGSVSLTQGLTQARQVLLSLSFILIPTPLLPKIVSTFWHITKGFSITLFYFVHGKMCSRDAMVKYFVFFGNHGFISLIFSIVATACFIHTQGTW
jgi:hypothetical protein